MRRSGEGPAQFLPTFDVDLGRFQCVVGVALVGDGGVFHPNGCARRHEDVDVVAVRPDSYVRATLPGRSQHGPLSIRQRRGGHEVVLTVDHKDMRFRHSHPQRSMPSTRRYPQRFAMLW